MKKEIISLSFAFIVVGASSFFAGYQAKGEQVAGDTFFEESLYAIDREGLLRDLEQAYILENFDTNTLVVFDEKSGYKYNDEATEAGEGMVKIYNQLIENNRIELQIKN